LEHRKEARQYNEMGLRYVNSLKHSEKFLTFGSRSDFIEQKSKPSYYVFVWRETVCEKLFEEPVLMLVSPKQSRLLAYSPQEGWYCINTKKMSRTNLPVRK
jgi:hypothetical protein